MHNSVHVCAYVYMHMYDNYVCPCLYMYVCMYVRMYACMYVYQYARIHV